MQTIQDFIAEMGVQTQCTFEYICTRYTLFSQIPISVFKWTVHIKSRQILITFPYEMYVSASKYKAYDKSTGKRIDSSDAFVGRIYIEPVMPTVVDVVESLQFDCKAGSMPLTSFLQEFSLTGSEKKINALKSVCINTHFQVKLWLGSRFEQFMAIGLI